MPICLYYEVKARPLNFEHCNKTNFPGKRLPENRSRSFLDSGNRPSRNTDPERFYHGFVLGLMVGLRDCYVITSNRESGFGRYDVILEPRKDAALDAIILEFKAHEPGEEADLGETLAAALSQIDQKEYVACLIAKGMPENRIRKYGFAFEGKRVLIGQDYN